MAEEEKKDETSAKKEVGDVAVIAEDSAPNRTILGVLLRKMGFRVIECSTGLAAWNWMEQNPTERPHIILSDIMMPEMDGIELLKKVRAGDLTKQIPFLFISAVAERERIFEAKNLGANGYILKPVTHARLTQKLKEIFPQRAFPVAS